MITGMLVRTLIAITVSLLLAVPAASAQKKRLKPREPVSCTGLGKKVIRNSIIRGDEYAVAVFGTCKIVVRDSHLIGKKYGALLAGTGQLVLINTTVESGNVALGHTGTGVIKLQNANVVGGRASVQLTGTGIIKGGKGTVFRGPKVHRGTGKLKLDRSVRWEKGGAPAPAPAAGGDVDDRGDHAEAAARPAPSKRRRHKAIRCDASQRYDLDGVIIDGLVGVSASGSCRVRLRNSVITGAGNGIAASGSARIVLINTTVHSPRGLALMVSGGATVDIVGGEIQGRRAYSVSGSATVSARNVVVRGPGSFGKNATYKDRGGNRMLRK